MNPILSAQARQQLELDPECSTVQIEDGATVKGLFSQVTSLRDEKGNIKVGSEQPRLIIHIDDAALLTERVSNLNIAGKRYGVNRILRQRELYLADLQLGASR